MTELIKPDIQKVVSQYTVLRPAGKHLRGSCPLHAERTPSFFIKPYSQTFRCYGCNASGDVIEFIKRAENLDFKSACERLGIELKPTEKTRREIQKKEAVRKFKAGCYEMHDELCRLYRTLQKAKNLCRTEAEVEAIAEYYHAENNWLHEMDLLQGDDDNAKLNLYQEAVNG